MEEKHEETVSNLISRLYMLENALVETQSDVKNKTTEILELEKEKKMKDEVIKNLNAGLTKKAAEMDEQENLKKETLKSERKALKKLRQKSGKEAVKNIIESDAEAINIGNDKLPDQDSKVQPVSVLAETTSYSLLFSSPVRQ